MSEQKKQEKKPRLHARNKNQKQYDLNALIKIDPELEKYIVPNKFGTNSVDFSNPIAVKRLNKAILNHYYDIKSWDFPDENLCPPIPGRADYIHHIADLLAENNGDKIPTGDKITCLDVGVGASCIYPIIGVTEYDWKFIGSDIDSASIASALGIVNANPTLKGKVEFQLQKNPALMFTGIIRNADKVDVTICNPPFHASLEEAKKGTRRKVKNLSGKMVKTPKLNFAGMSNELICEGGEYKFIHSMISESKNNAKNCFWFTTLVSNAAHLKGLYNLLEKMEASQIKAIPMGTGNKISRILAWTFLSEADQKTWRETRF